MTRAAPVVACLLGLLATVAAQSPPPGTLTGGDRLAAVYDAALDADFAEAERQRLAACPPAPDPACQLLAALTLWWRLQLDPGDRQHDAAFERAVTVAIEAARRATVADPGDAGLWFYLGAAHGARAQWRGLRGDPLAAAREGRAIKQALERALALDPQLDDARFGLGLYQYYAGTAPRLLRMLRWLLLLPGGNRAAGLAMLERAHEAGGLVSSEAAYQLHAIYLWYEGRFTDARALIDALARRYPRSPLFPQVRATIDDVYLHDPAESLRGWKALLGAARAGEVHMPALAEGHARLAIASHLDRLDESDRALAHLEAIAGRPDLPHGVEAQAHLLRGRIHDRLGDRARADADYAAAVAAAPGETIAEVRRDAARARREAPSPEAAQAYRLALEGWRALEAGDVARAWARLDDAWTRDPRNVVTRYRRARALLARGEAGEAFTEFDAVLAMRPVAPPATRLEAFIHAAALAERFAQPARARALYAQAARVEGADRVRRDHAAREAARLVPPTR